MLSQILQARSCVRAVCYFIKLAQLANLRILAVCFLFFFSVRCRGQYRQLLCLKTLLAENLRPVLPRKKNGIYMENNIF